MAPAGAGTPTKKLPAQAGRLGIVDHHVEAGEPQARGDGEHHRGDPAGGFEVVQSPEIEDQRRRDAEIDEVGKAVELGAEARGALEEPRQPAVDAVEDCGEHDGREREIVALLERHADRGEPRAQREQRDDVRHQRAHRDEPEALPPQAFAFEIGTIHCHISNIKVSRRARHAAPGGWLTASTDAKCPPRVRRLEVGEHRLAGDGGLALGNDGAHAVRQIDVDARAETDHADALAGAEFDAFAAQTH